MKETMSRISRFTALPALAVMAALLMASCSEGPAPAFVLDAERAVLEALYETAGGVIWSENGNWLSDAPLGEWHGVTTDGSGRVIELNLRRNRLSGEIPPWLGGLSNLEYLDLRRNQLSGEIPPERGGLSNVRRLYLSNNQLSGCIPGGLRDVEESDLWELGLPFCG